MLFARQIEARLKYRLGSQTQMRIEESPESRVWINDGVGNRWVGIASPPFRRQAVLLTVTVASLASLIVLIAAAFYARVLSRPLERLAASAATIANGEFVANAESLHATREVQQLQAALEQAAASVRDAGSEREMLLAGVSHDIRTPLARLRYLHELHPSGDADADAAVLRNINDIDRLVGQFIDYARDGREEAKALLDPLQMLGQLCEEAAERGCVWEFEHEACGDLRCHAMALTRAIRNLMRNAENHGAAPFRLSLDSRDTSLCITVSDSGAGVTEQDWSRLVRPFQRGGELTRPAGAGLGLAIACRVAAIHGGRILSRRHAGGFEVTLQLPRPAATTS